MKRRDFLSNSAKTISLGAVIPGFQFSAVNTDSMLGRLLAAGSEDNDHVLVIIQLTGGNDGINTLIPLDQYTGLSAVRGNVLIKDTEVLRLQGIDKTGIHPAMTGIQSLYKDGKVGFIQSVGYANQNFSHFRSTDIWLSGSDATEVLNTGWMGRYLDYVFPNYPNDYPNATMPDPLAIQIGSMVSTGFLGPMLPMAVAITSDKNFYNLVNGSHSTVDTTTSIGKELAYIREVTGQAQTYNDAIKKAAEKVTTQSTYPTSNSLADQLKIVAKLIKGGLKTKMYMVTLGGFDTHAGQVDPTDTKIGAHATLLSKLSEAIYAFQNDLKFLGVEDRVVGMTFSEFGRRIVSNGSAGTDHGSSLPVMVFGSKVSNGIIGTNPVISSDAKVADNLMFQFDYRSVYASLLEQWFCFDKKVLNTILLKDYQTIPIIQKSACTTDSPVSIHDYQKSLDQVRLQCYPNPFTDNVAIEIESLGGVCIVQIFNTEGKLIEEIDYQTLPKGHHSYKWNSDHLPTGFYHCRFQNENYQSVVTMQKVR